MKDLVWCIFSTFFTISVAICLVLEIIVGSTLFSILFAMLFITNLILLIYDWKMYYYYKKNK